MERRYSASTYIVIMVFLFAHIISGQTKESVLKSGNSFIRNFSPKEYLAGPQNWCSVQDSNGIMYFGNQSGILQYDGVKWRTISVGNQDAVFSIAIDSMGTIWCGTHDDVGFLTPDSLGQLIYISIGQSLADSLKPLGRVRQIIASKEGLFFRTSKYLIRKKKNLFKVWTTKTSFYKMQLVNDLIHIYETNIALKTLIDDTLIIPAGGELFKNNPTTTILPFSKDTLLVATWKDGLFLFTNGSLNKFVTSIDERFKINPIIDVQFLSPDKILLAGFNKGSYIINRTGILLQIFNKSTGLIDEYCNNTFIDKNNGLWFSNNNGISRVEINSPFSIWGENEGVPSKVRFITRFNEKLLAATDDKVLSLVDSEDNLTVSIKSLPGLSNCWFLLPIGNNLLAATNNGVYEVNNNNSRLLSKGQSKSFCLLRSVIDTNIVYVGTEEGLALLSYANDKWKYMSKVKEIKYEIRQMFEMSDSTLWLGTHNHGIIKANLYDDKISPEFYEISDGLKDLKSYRISNVDGKLFFSSPLSVPLLYDRDKGRFYKDSVYFNISQPVSRIVKDKDENLWIRKITNEGAKILYGNRLRNLDYNFEENPYNRLSGLSAQFIFPDKNNITWFGTSLGLIQYDSKKQSILPIVFPAQIRKVKTGETILFLGHNLDDDQQIIPELPYLNNAIRFEFSLGSFETREALRFQYYLEGYNNDWSDWTDEIQKDYTNLFEGNYKFNVRGKDIYGNISTADIYEFKILPPWYRSLYAYLSYLILFIISIFIIDRIRTKQLNKRNRVELERKLKQQQAIEKAKSDERQMVRKKTAADFHDELGHMLTKISLFTEMAKRSVKGNEGAEKHLRGVGENASHLSSGMKDLIWTLDSEKDSLYDTLIRIKDFGDVLFEHSKISFATAGFPDELSNIKISMDMKRHLILIFKEVMNNCLKYSECKYAEFIVHNNQNVIQLIFRDDGKGFDIEAKTKGNGIKNMKMRADNINAAIEIRSELEKTEVILKLNIDDENIPNG